jgi:GntR family transcriptional regulator, transcriptional repressor for pyruvate dehydrogenase complex
MMEPVVSPAIYELIAERISRQIHLGIYLPGDRLPSERTLAQQMVVSRVTVREALRVLEGKGYIESQRGAGGGPLVLAQHLSPARLRELLREQLERFINILDYRLANESASARLAALKRSDEHLTILAQTIDDMHQFQNLPQFRRADSVFHLTIADATRNPFLRQAVEDGRAAMFLPVDALDFQVMLDHTTEEHEQILATIADANPAKAEQAMANHIETTRRDLYTILEIRKEHL